MDEPFRCSEQELRELSKLLHNDDPWLTGVEVYRKCDFAGKNFRESQRNSRNRASLYLRKFIPIKFVCLAILRLKNGDVVAF